MEYRPSSEVLSSKTLVIRRGYGQEDTHVTFTVRPRVLFNVVRVSQDGSEIVVASAPDISEAASLLETSVEAYTHETGAQAKPSLHAPTGTDM
jgi:hypothetical protein